MAEHKPTSVRVVAPADLLQELESRLASPTPSLKAGRKRRRRFGAAGAMVGAIAMAIALVVPALAVHNAVFQLDGNTAVDTPPATGPFANTVYDWESLFHDTSLGSTGDAGSPTVTLPADFQSADFVEDFSLDADGDYVNHDPTTFTGGSSKDNNDVSQWRCVGANNVTDKGDITNAYATLYDNGTDRILYFGMEKTAGQGDNNVGLWVLQDPKVGCPPDQTGNGTAFSGTHMDGDLFIVSEFTNGGEVSSVKVYAWESGAPSLLVSGVDCGNTAPDDAVCATTNGVDIDPQWDHFSKVNGVNAGMPPATFYEGGINLNDFPQFTNTCFNGFLFNTRSSQELTAELYDWALGDINSCNPAVEITKSPSVTDVCSGSDTTVTYSYEVTNTGNIDLTDLVIDDDTIPGAQAAFEAANGGSNDLAEGASVSFTLDATINATTHNVVTVTADSQAGADSATASASADVAAHDCTISMVKSPDITDVCNGSQTTVTYSYTVTNNSDQFSVSGTIVDDQVANVPGFGPLAPGASVTVTATGIVSGTLTNNATATGDFDDPATATATATASATVTGHDCTISLTKTPRQTEVCNGSTVTYDYHLTNNSDEFVWNGSLTDDVLGDINLAITLAAGASADFTADGVINGAVHNIATATGSFHDPADTTAAATADATVTGHDCTITLTKTPRQTTVCNGSTVTYDYHLTNNSDLFIWNGSLTDDVLGTIDGSISLAAGDSADFTADGVINGVVHNVATADGAFDDPASTTASTTADATVTGHDCTISLTKVPRQTDVCNGSTVTYDYTLTNNSDQYGWSGSLTDDVLGTIASSISLPAGGSVSYAVPGVINGTVHNTATADGAFDDPASTTADATADATVNGHDCTISITKEPSATNVCNGSTVTYTITVTNNSDQFDWTGDVVDDVLGNIELGVTIPAGDSKTYTPSDVINGTVHNTVTATGTFNDPTGPVSANATADATVHGHTCTISLTKTPSDTDVCNGDSVTYTYVVTNDSDYFTWEGTLSDDKLGAIDGTITLDPGESETFTASAVINGTVVNTATASGSFDDPHSTSASDTASATVVGTPCGEGCTPGFWQGGLGVTLWNTIPDAQWTSHGGVGDPPYTTTTVFSTFFKPTGVASVDNSTMLQLVGSGGGSNWARKAARDVVAAYLNASFGLTYPVTTAQIITDWEAAVAAGTSGYQAFHLKYAAFNELGCSIH